MVPPSTRQEKASLAPKRNFTNAFLSLPVSRQRLTSFGCFFSPMDLLPAACRSYNEISKKVKVRCEARVRRCY
jgi:hypothetical protein